MTERGLQVTCRRRQALGAYLTIAHLTGQKASRTQATVDGLFVSTHRINGLPIGMTAPRKATLVAPNELLAEPPVSRPLRFHGKGI
jgi:hypothetical protein